MIYTCKLTAQISSCNKLSWQKVSEFVALTSFWCEITFPSLTCVLSADLKYIDFLDALQQDRFGLATDSWVASSMIHTYI